MYISDLVIKEVSRGDTDEVKKRLTITTLIKSLNVNEKVRALARKFVDQRALPKKANEDALHIAVGTINNMDCIVTWNLKHIGNINMRKKLLKICRKEGYELPIVCTPEELIGE